MAAFRAVFFIFLFFIAPIHTFAAENVKCESHLSAQIPASGDKLLSESLRKTVYRFELSREARGYSILIATMIASAAATTYLSSALPPDFQFISHFLAQISTLGVYVFGAPIWEPLSSGFRKIAFGVRQGEVGAGAGSTELDREFESLWRRTQENYSLNQQMSRNVITQFLISVHQNFYEAYRAAHDRNPEYAADQVAEAAVRLRTLFREIAPDDPSLVGAIQAAFTHHVAVDEAFAQSVARRIANLDERALSDEGRSYYQRIFSAWLGQSPTLHSINERSH